MTSELTARQRAQFAQHGVRVVLIDPMNVPDDTVPSIGATNFSGGMAATEHLLKLGHRRIAMIEGRTTPCATPPACTATRPGSAVPGSRPIPASSSGAAFRFEPAYQAALELFALDDPPTAVFAGNDLQAFGVIEAARVQGLRVPEDVSVVGFDDTAAASTSAPPLTTVRQPFAEIGRAALRTLLRLTAGEPLDSHRVELATQLVVRSSTAPPPTTSPSRIHAPPAPPPRGTHHDHTWADPACPRTDRVDALLAEMTLEEKLAQLGSAWAGVERDSGNVAPMQDVFARHTDFERGQKGRPGPPHPPLRHHAGRPGRGARALAALQRE